MDRTELMIDIETYSDIDIGKAGHFKYAQSPAFEILLFAYKYIINGVPQETQCIDLACGEALPEELISDLSNPAILKHAFNASFEWWCLNASGRETLIDQWHCTQIEALYHGYPRSLKNVGIALGLDEDKAKLKTGTALISYFCKPCKPTKANGGRTRNLPQHDPEKWDLFKEYNIRDVDAEYAVHEAMGKFEPVPEAEWALWRMDVLMNAHGVGVDMDLVEGAIALDEMDKDRLINRAVELTGLNNPNSTAQLLPWINSRVDEPIDNLRKDTVTKLVESTEDPVLREVLRIRQQVSKTSIKKYTTISTASRILEDGSATVVSGISQFYGTHTGRWAGRLVQMQNLTKHHMSDGLLHHARELVKKKDYDGCRLLFGDVSDLLSQLVRTAFIPARQPKFVVADFSAIEARVIAWLAGEEWVNEVFRTTGKIYEATASQMFGVPIEKIVKGNPEYALRQRGKVATLALGYQGGTGALKAMGALDMGIPEDELQGIVDLWRKANPNIVGLWYAIEDAVIKVVQSGHPMGMGPYIKLRTETGAGEHPALVVDLPSGRSMYYPEAHLELNKFGKYALHYKTQGATAAAPWVSVETYGGKLTENIVQAIARDCLAEVLRRISNIPAQDVLDKPYTVFHVHDEVIVEAPESMTVEGLCALMAEPIPWAPGLVLKGAGFEKEFYIKD